MLNSKAERPASDQNGQDDSAEQVHMFPKGRLRDVILALTTLVVILVVARGSLAILGTDTYERGEEYVRGSVATAITGGLDLPIESLIYHHYEGGGFVQALVTIPFFAVLGPSLLAHKVVAICTEILVLLAGCLLARRAFGFRAMLIFGALFIFSPMPFQKLALLNLGIHYQALVFQFLVAGLTLRLLQEKRDPSVYRASTPWLLGVAGGFGFFYNYQLAPLIGLAGLVLIYRKTLTRKRFGHLICGCLIGVSPLLFMASRVGMSVFDIHAIQEENSAEDENELLAEGTTELPEAAPQKRAPRIDANQLEILAMKERRAPTLSKLPGGIIEASGARGFLQLLLFLTLPVWGIWGYRRRKVNLGSSERDATLLLTGYLAAFACVIPFTGFLVTYFPEYFLVMRYTPFWAFATLLVAGLCSSLLSSPKPLKKRLGLLCFGLTFSLGCWSYASGVSQGTQPSFSVGFSRLVDRRGTDYRAYYSKLAGRMEVGQVETLRILTQVTGIPRDELYSGAAEGVYRHSKQTLPEIVAEMKEASPDHWKAFLPGLGAWTMKGKRLHFRLAELAIKNGITELRTGGDKARIRDLLSLGLGRFGTGAPLDQETLESELNKLQSGRFPDSIFHGFGHRCYRLFLLRPEAFERFLAPRSEEVQALVRSGYEQASQMHSIDYVDGTDG